MTRVAAFDCGTNSLRLLIADVDGGVLRDIVRTLEIVRLGQGVDRTGRFDDGALRRTLEVTRRYGELCREHGVERMRFVATSATRDAANRDEFLSGVRDILGIEPEVIAGSEEAELSFLGTLSAVRGADVASPASRLVVDIGGGSTELVLGTVTPEAAHSMDVGSVRLTERHLRNDPPTADELAGVRRDVEAALNAAPVDLSAAEEVVGVAGTITTVTAHALDLPRYDPDAISGSRLPLQQVLAACDSLASMPREQRAALPYLHPGRVDVIAAGAVIWSTVLERAVAAGSPLEWVVTSEHDILDGVALSLA
ncbi:Ppx/GppA family phosphatase [Salinibacterium sp. SYSU T00001]|uniref:Ppx/GppA phosphatase family protein n=1 Tax=Homoserinimonas sedimenticola TaxID=2986805 RepID=UPI0022361B6A|nr:Ppx/GppA phosphatase family protein [Salinibacterium sedimenticola]MCW4386182.1 Ppx/GppA family phosphatase [Salinibacterium sedimenticola]